MHETRHQCGNRKPRDQANRRAREHQWQNGLNCPRTAAPEFARSFGPGASFFQQKRGPKGAFKGLTRRCSGPRHSSSCTVRRVIGLAGPLNSTLGGSRKQMIARWLSQIFGLLFTIALCPAQTPYFPEVVFHDQPEISKSLADWYADHLRAFWANNRCPLLMFLVKGLSIASCGSDHSITRSLCACKSTKTGADSCT